MNTENSKMNEPNIFVLNLSQRLDLKGADKRATLQNLSVYYTWKNRTKQYKNNKLKVIAPTWNDEFEFPDGCYCVSDILNYIIQQYIIKKYGTLTTISPIHFYIHRSNNRSVFRIKNEYKLEWQTPETMKLFGSTKKLIDKTKDRENVPSLEVVEVVLVHCNLADNQSEVLYTFTLNKSYAYLLNVESSNVVFLKTYDIECDEPIIKFADQNCTPLEIEDVIASILRSHCNYGNAYIVVKGRIRATGTKDDNK